MWKVNMDNDSVLMKSEAMSPTDQGASEELAFLRELLMEANDPNNYPESDFSCGYSALEYIRIMLYKRIQEVEMRDWNI